MPTPIAFKLKLYSNKCQEVREILCRNPLTLRKFYYLNSSLKPGGECCFSFSYKVPRFGIPLVGAGLSSQVTISVHNANVQIPRAGLLRITQN